MKNLKIVQAYDLPGNPDADSVYELLPKDFSQSYYDERTDRNIGWITREEQEMLKNSVVGIAGCGGMGERGSITGCCGGGVGPCARAIRGQSSRIARKAKIVLLIGILLWTDG